MMVPNHGYGQPDPKGEVDLLLAARNPHFGVSASGPGHETRLHALRQLRSYSPAREGRLARILLIVAAASVALTFLIAIVLSGPRDGVVDALNVLYRLAVGGAFLALIFAGIIGGFLAVLFLVTSPRRVVAALRRRRARTRV
jgi:hypothetical protein